MATDYQTKQRHRNMVVGLFVIVAMVSFFFFLWRFRDLPRIVSKIESFEILVYFPEAPGVEKDTSVKYCGYQIGRVTNVAPPRFYNGSHRVPITIAIQNEFKDISSKSEIFVMKKGLGSSYVEIFQPVSFDAENTEFLKRGMVIEDGKIGMSSDFLPPEFQAKLEELVDSIGKLTDNANVIIGDQENQENLKKTFANVEIATLQANEALKSIIQFSEKGQEQVEKLAGQADTTLKSFTELSELGQEKVETLSDQADNTLKSVQNLADTGAEKVELLADYIGSVTDQVEMTLSEIRQVAAKINGSEGTAGKLINDGRLYENLMDSSRELEMALEQLKEWTNDAREKGIRIKW